MPRVRLLQLFIAGLLGVYAPAARAANVTINPVRIHLSAAKRSELIELRNTGVEPARFQLQANAWHETSDGEMKLKPTRDLLFFPSLLEIPPGQTKRVRVASTVAPGRVERTYRLIAEEFPRAPTPGVVQVLTRFSVPVFVQPDAPKPRPAVEARIENSRLVISVANAGNAAFKADSVRVVARSALGEVVFEQSVSGWYVLANGRRRYELDLSASNCKQITALDVSARTDAGNPGSVHDVQPGAGCGG